MAISEYRSDTAASLQYSATNLVSVTGVTQGPLKPCAVSMVSVIALSRRPIKPREDNLSIIYVRWRCLPSHKCRAIRQNQRQSMAAPSALRSRPSDQPSRTAAFRALVWLVQSIAGSRGTGSHSAQRVPGRMKDRLGSHMMAFLGGAHPLNGIMNACSIVSVSRCKNFCDRHSCPAACAFIRAVMLKILTFSDVPGPRLRGASPGVAFMSHHIGSPDGRARPMPSISRCVAPPTGLYGAGKDPCSCE